MVSGLLDASGASYSSLNGGISETETPHGFPPLQSSPLCLPLALTESLDEIRIDELIYVQVQPAIHE